MLFLVLATAFAGCDKVVHPALGNYPKDANPVGGPLKFYAAFEKITADSIRATYATTDSVISYVTGASGQAVQFSPVLGSNGNDSVFSFLIYPNANDFASTATSFTLSFWLNIPLSKKDNSHAVGILSLSSTKNFWGNITVYADDNDKGNSDSMNLKFHFANGLGDNWDFAGYTGTNRWPGMYDGNWHQVAFTYDATAKTGTVYRDGVQFDQKTNETILFDGFASNLVVGGYQEAANVYDNYADNTWMNGWPGAIDQLRFYAEALSASDVAALYANKQ